MSMYQMQNIRLLVAPNEIERVSVLVEWKYDSSGEWVVVADPYKIGDIRVLQSTPNVHSCF